MNFSSYTLAGHVFLGGGVELTPGKWRIGAMYGRLKKPVPFNFSDSTQHYSASFRRMGYGLKVGYENQGNAVSINLFSAKDDLRSIPFVLPESNLTPQQNIALSIHVRKQLIERIFLEAEYGLSSLNNDIRATPEQDTVSKSRNSNLLRGLLPANATTRYFDAFKGCIGYQGSWYGLQVNYERIAPEYQTLGAYYFNNDMENLTLAPTLRLLRNTFTLTANTGVKRNNLDKSRNATTKRFVGSLNAI